MGEINSYDILVKILERRHSSEDLGVDGKNIRIVVMELRWEYVDWIHLVQDRDQWWTLVNTVMNLRVLQKSGNLTN
jgi:hypothetical protein